MLDFSGKLEGVSESISQTQPNDAPTFESRTLWQDDYVEGTALGNGDTDGIVYLWSEEDGTSGYQSNGSRIRTGPIPVDIAETKSVEPPRGVRHMPLIMEDGYIVQGTEPSHGPTNHLTSSDPAPPPSRP